MQIIISGQYNIRMTTNTIFGEYYNYDCIPCKFDGILATLNTSKFPHCDTVQIFIRPNDMPDDHKLRPWMPRYPIQGLDIYCHMSNENIEKEKTSNNIEYAYCDYCGDSYGIDELNLMANDSLVCKNCYEQAIAEMKGEA